MRSFRLRLALRFTLTMLAGLCALSVLTYAVLRDTLDRQLNASLLNVASIQAASVTDAPSGEMRFHEWELTQAEAAQVRDLNRYAQIWNEDGESLLRTRYVTADLPLDTAALRGALAGELTWAEATFQSIPVRSLYYPLGRLGHLHAPHVLQVAAPLLARNEMLRAALLALLAITLVISAGTFLGSWWLAERTVRPVHEIIDQAEAIEAGTLERRIAAYADSQEYQRLVQVLNTMLDRLDSAFEAQRRFTADASHELRSPLTALRGEIELALRRPRSPEEYRQVLESGQEEVARLSRITEDLLTLARSDTGMLNPRFGPIQPLLLARELAPRLQALAPGQRVAVTVSGPEDVVIDGDADLIRRLLWNLGSNAVRFSPAGGEVAIRLARELERVVLEVADQGPGVPAAERERIFERFYQADPARNTHGTGLGLAIAKVIADLHGATVEVTDAAAGGALFRVGFPAANDRPDVSAGRASPGSG